MLAQTSRIAPKEVLAVLVEFPNDAELAAGSGSDSLERSNSAGSQQAMEALNLLNKALAMLTEINVTALDRKVRLDLSRELARGKIRMDAIRSGVLAEVDVRKDWE
ncbi:MAG: hypothetical protein GX037_01000, partial [Trueperella sp.]|nr:hypothetical protein [Trueperella sp.]